MAVPERKLTQKDQRAQLVGRACELEYDLYEHRNCGVWHWSLVSGSNDIADAWTDAEVDGEGFFVMERRPVIWFRTLDDVAEWLEREEVLGNAR
jgi:hypothetical protein